MPLRFLDCFKDSDEWEKLVPHDPHYSPGYYRAYGGGELVVRDGSASPIVQPFRYQGDGWIGNAYQYGGPVGPYNNAPIYREEWDDWKVKQGLSERCTICPFVMSTLAGRKLENRDVVLVDVTDIRVRSTTRHMVEKAQRHKAKAELSDDVAAFEKMYNTAMERKKAKDHWVYPQGFFAKVLKELPGQSALMLTKLDGELESGCLLIHNGKVCYYHWAATYGHKRDSGANHFQVWSVLNWARERELSYVHLGGGLTAEKDSLWTFKSGFSPISRAVFSYTTKPK